jgi:crotonobetainyl-CoA:carnitine CoA-transferase CaiB-like acyl-CoA transferase
VEDPQVEHLGIVVPIESPHEATHAVRPPAQFDGARAHSVRAAPLLDEHGAAIRGELAQGVAWPEREASLAGVEG